MAGYRYGGSDFDTHEPLAEPKPRRAYNRGPAKCGTTTGYEHHRRAKEPSCEPCLAAVRAYRKDWRDRVRIREGKTPRIKKEPKVMRRRNKTAACGTNSGYEAHTRYQDGICQPCRDAHNAYMRDYKAKRRAEGKAA